MALTLDGIKSSRLKTSFEYAGETVNLTYNPQHVTPNKEDEIKRLRGEEANRKLLEWLSEALVEWDVLQTPKGKPVPHTPEALGALPWSFLWKVMRALFEGAEDEGETVKNSGEPSSLAGN